jgi:ribosomal-protein-alanine N-acetyltransferase
VTDSEPACMRVGRSPAPAGLEQEETAPNSSCSRIGTYACADDMPPLTRPAVPAGRLAWMAQPILTVDELVIRPWQDDDAPAVLAAYRDPGIRRWHARTLDDVAEARVLIASWREGWPAETGAGWAVTRDGVLVGRIGFRHLDLAEAAGKIAYWIVPAARGAAIAVRVADAVCGWMFTVVGLRRVQLDHSTANPASCRVAAQAGFRLEGTRRGQALHEDGWHDMHMHARLAGDSLP